MNLDDDIADRHDELGRLLFADLEELVPLVFSHNKPISEAKIRLIVVIL